MKGYGEIKIADYTYDLPDSKIARYPLPERDMSKLLHWNGSVISDRIFRDLPDLLDHRHRLVFNNTRVIRARLLFTKESGAVIEIFCLEPLTPPDFQLSLSSGPGVEWKCLVGNLKRWKRGNLSLVFRSAGTEHLLRAENTGRDGEACIIRFSWDDSGISFGEILESMGHVPIPPYLGRNDEESDRSSYQTTYARIDGSVAAPTAGLHFTPSLLSEIAKRGIRRSDITLHVSAGTFRPVKSDTMAGHRMHTEHFFIDAGTVAGLCESETVAVGTTTVRTLESLYWLGAAIASGHQPEGDIPLVSQWAPYGSDCHLSTEAAMEALLRWMEKKKRNVIEVKTEIIILPGYNFRIVKGLITNFHQPASTLLLLVAALTGRSWRDIYDHALEEGYRFLSYGDSMLLQP